jgi:hypothetical protein
MVCEVKIFIGCGFAADLSGITDWEYVTHCNYETFFGGLATLILPIFFFRQNRH